MDIIHYGSQYTVYDAHVLFEWNLKQIGGLPHLY